MNIQARYGEAVSLGLGPVRAKALIYGIILCLEFFIYYVGEFTCS